MYIYIYTYIYTYKYTYKCTIYVYGVIKEVRFQQTASVTPSFMLAQASGIVACLLLLCPLFMMRHIFAKDISLNVKWRRNVWF